jgi:antitoxin HigA-1
LDAALPLADLGALPGNRLETLCGDRAGQHSIRINDQWRICFEWPDGSPGPTNQRRDCGLSLRRFMVRTPIHPGEHLAQELTELGIAPAELGRQIEVPADRITAIVNGQRGISADTALRLGHWFGTSAEFWLNLQNLYELRMARRRLGVRLERLPGMRNKHRHSCAA